MTPRLYAANESTFLSYGESLLDCAVCEVTEERNGEFTLYMEYPKSGSYAEDIEIDKIILAKPYENASQAEPFRIVDISATIDGSLAINAEHISYQLNSIIIGANSNHSTRYPATMWSTLVNSYQISSVNPFTFDTDMTSESQTVRSYAFETPTPLRTIVGGMEGSMLDLFGGELKWERWKVSLLSARGADNGVVIAYGKNITGIDYKVDLNEYYNAVIAYYSNGNNYVESAVQSVGSTLAYTRTIVVDASSEFNSTPTVAQLNTWAADYLTKNYKAPKISVSVNFVPLWQSDEYKDYYELEHVALCDTVKVVYAPLNVSVKSKVVKTVYDVLTERYTEIVVGSAEMSLDDTIASLVKEVKK